MKLPYESARSGDLALAETQRILSKFGCSTFGMMTDVERGASIVQFRWHEKQVSLEASWKGYAAAYMKAHPWSPRMRKSRAQYEALALEQAKISVCSILRDWVKGQVTAVECGLMGFDAAFLPHMVLPNGYRIVEYVQEQFPQLSVQNP